MAPDDPRHGTNKGYQAHLDSDGDACEPCKAAHARANKELRTRAYLARGPLVVECTGTRRRIQALAALGHTWADMDRFLGRWKGFSERLAIRDPRPVHRTTAEAAARMYEVLCMALPPQTPRADQQRARARAAGWAPPLAWDRIDDPNETPRGVQRGHQAQNRDQVDEAVVLRVLAGEHLATTRAEKEEILARHLAAGGSESELCRRMGWKEGRYTRRTRQGVAA